MTQVTFWCCLTASYQLARQKAGLWDFHNQPAAAFVTRFMMGSLTDQPKELSKWSNIYIFFSSYNEKTSVRKTFTFRCYRSLAKIKTSSFKIVWRLERSASVLNLYVLKYCYLCGPFVTDTRLLKHVFLFNIQERVAYKETSTLFMLIQ